MLKDVYTENALLFIRAGVKSVMGVFNLDLGWLVCWSAWVRFSVRLSLSNPLSVYRKYCACESFFDPCGICTRGRCCKALWCLSLWAKPLSCLRPTLVCLRPTVLFSTIHPTNDSHGSRQHLKGLMVPWLGASLLISISLSLLFLCVQARFIRLSKCGHYDITVCSCARCEAEPTSVTRSRHRWERVQSVAREVGPC